MKIIIILFLVVSIHAKDYTKNQKTLNFINQIVKEHNFKRSYLLSLFKDVKTQFTPLKAFTKKKKKVSTPALKKRYPFHGSWDRYAKHKVTAKRIKQGREFLRKYRTAFKKVEQKYGVPKEYIAAIIGVETVYGRNVGKYPVFDTLTTLAFENNRRSKFFKYELKKLILLSYREKFNLKNVKGSYAGAIGLGQFMPSNYEAYGVDFNHDGKIRLQNPVDAIASIANYLKKNGWKRGQPVATRVSYSGNRFRRYKTGYNKKYNRSQLRGITPKFGKWDYKEKVRLIKLDRATHDELWYGARNFYIITRYNHSAYYAMAIHKLASSF